MLFHPVKVLLKVFSILLESFSVCCVPKYLVVTFYVMIFVHTPCKEVVETDRAITFS